MHRKIAIGISIAQRKKIREKVSRGGLSKWVSLAVSELIALDKNKPISFSNNWRKHEKNCLYFWLSEEENLYLDLVVNRVRKQGYPFSRAAFAFEAVERKIGELEEATNDFCVKKCRIEVRIDRQSKQEIKKTKEKTHSRRRQNISEWVGRAAEEFLCLDQEIDPFPSPGNNFYWEEADPMVVFVSPETKQKIHVTVDKLKKINPKFSITLLFDKAVRKKLERETCQTV